MEPADFLTLLKSVLSTPDNRVCLAHASGSLFVSVPEMTVPAGENLATPGSLFVQHLEGGQPVSIQRGISGATKDERLVAMITSSPPDLPIEQPLVVLVSRNIDAVLAPWRYDLAILASVYLLCAAAAIGFTSLTLRRRAELDRLHRSRRLILKNVGEGVFGLDRTGGITFVNEAAKRLLGWHHGDLLGLGPHQSFHSLYVGGVPYAEAQCPIHQTLKDGQARTAVDEFFTRPDGALFPVEFTITPLREQASLIGAVVVFRDVSASKRAADATQARLRLLSAVPYESLDEVLRMTLDEIERLTGSAIGFYHFVQADQERSPCRLGLRTQFRTCAPRRARAVITQSAKWASGWIVWPSGDR